MNFDQIIREVADHYRLTPAQLVGYDRKRRIARARHLAMLICREDLRASFPSIADVFNRDHSTVIHGIRAMSDKMKKPDVGYDYEADRKAILHRLRVLPARGRRNLTTPYGAYHATIGI